MDISSMLGGLGGGDSASASKEFGRSSAEISYGAIAHTGSQAAPDWLPWAILGGLALLLVLFLTKR